MQNLSKERRPGASIFFLLAVPLLLQFHMLANKFVRVQDSWEPVLRGKLTFIAVAATGLLLFHGWRRMAWMTGMLVLTLAVYRSLDARSEWPVWYSVHDAKLYRNYIVQVMFLGFIPVIAVLCRDGRFRSAGRTAVGAAAVIQAVGIFAHYARVRWDLLASMDGILFMPVPVLAMRDSSGLYEEAWRLTGFLNNSNLLGIVLTLTWPALLPEWREGSHRWRDFAPYALVALAISAIWMTYSRAAYIGLLLQAGVLAILEVRRRKSATTRGGVVLALGALLALGAFAAPKALSRLAAVADLADASILNRVKVYAVAANLIAERPLSGWGPAFFSTLYNRFYKITNEAYSFPEAHSAVLHTLMEIGLVGVLLFGLVFLGVRPLENLKRLPRYVWLGPLGCFVPLIADNPTNHPAFLVPFVWLAGVCIAGSLVLEKERDSGAENGRFRWASPVRLTLCFGGLWLAGYLIPFKSPTERFAEELRKCWRGPTGTLGFFVEDYVSGQTWELMPDQPMEAASVAKLAIAAAALNHVRPAAGPDQDAHVELTPVSEGSSGIVHHLPRPSASMELGNALCLMLELSDNACANALLDHLGMEQIAQACRQITGAPVYIPDGFGRALPPFGEGVSDSGAYAGAEMTPRQAASLIKYVVNDTSPLGEIARNALRVNSNRWGLARYLHSIGPIYHKSGTTGTVHNDVLLYQNGGEHWVASVFREDEVPRSGIDQPANRALGAMAWKCHLFLGR